MDACNPRIKGTVLKSRSFCTIKQLRATIGMELFYITV